jgi:hypothetical protein
VSYISVTTDLLISNLSVDISLVSLCHSRLSHTCTCGTWQCIIDVTICLVPRPSVTQANAIGSLAPWHCVRSAIDPARPSTVAIPKQAPQQQTHEQRCVENGNGTSSGDKTNPSVADFRLLLQPACLSSTGFTHSALWYRKTGEVGIKIMLKLHFLLCATSTVTFCMYF